MKLIVAFLVTIIAVCPVGVSVAQTEWQETPNQRGVAILVHGLNNSPTAMRPLAVVLRSLGFTTGIVTLDGHGGPDEAKVAAANDWIQTVRNAVAEAKQRYADSPLLGVGFSLGGAVCLRALGDGSVDFRRIVLIAPAIELKGYTSFLRLMTWLRFAGVALPSFIPPEYRSRSTTPLEHYAFLFEIADALRTHPLDRRAITTPGLVILREADEFISRTRTERFRRERGFEDWRMVTLSGEVAGLPAHLMVDERSFGAAEWRRFVGTLSDFLDDF